MPVPKDDNVETLRFSWLLQPIRDLTKNWDIDVAASLEDYLGEVSSPVPGRVREDSKIDFFHT